MWFFAQVMIQHSILTGDRREAHLPAKQPSTSQDARFPCAHEHSRGPCGPQVPPCQGPGPSDGLIDRIRHRDAFTRLRRNGVRVRIDPLWCSFVPDSEVVPPQVAFAIGRASGSAVQRNRLRRRLRAILHDCDVPPGLLLIGVGPHANKCSFDDLSRATRAMITTLSSRTIPQL